MICRSKLGIGKNIQVGARSESVIIKFYEQICEGHTHYIMNLAFNPEYDIIFLSAASIAQTKYGSSTPNFSKEAHEKRVN